MSEQKGRHVISTSPKKNLQEVVYHNTDIQGKKFSITRFEKLDPSKPHYQRVFPKAPK